MTITLTPDQIRWLESQVEVGRFSSVEEGVRAAVTELMLVPIDENDDLAWAKPLVDEAIAEAGHDKPLTIDAFREHAARRAKSLRR